MENKSLTKGINKPGLFKMLCTAMISFAIIFAKEVSAQNIYKTFENFEITNGEIDDILAEYGYKKTIPKEFKKPIAIALLYYPELKDVRITFNLAEYSSPLIAQPTVLSAMFRNARSRHYVIGISTDSSMKPVLFENLSLDAQIGVIAHELSHISEFIKRNRIGLLSIAVGNLRTRYMDRLEYDTDQRTIDHGLGYQLLTWSRHVRMAYAVYVVGLENVNDITEVTEYNPRERYMYPETIEDIIDKHPLYSQPSPVTDLK
ncbi:MAG: hypothetical protein ACK4ND_10055 [Cytophagaceae bacterium]